MKPGDILYRCDAYIDDLGEVVVLYDEFQVLRETAEGVWIRRIPFASSRERWMSKSARRPFAFATKGEALHDMLRRKRVRNAFLRGELADNERILEELGCAVGEGVHDAV